MKDQTVEKLWNVIICVGLGGLTVLFSFMFSSFMLLMQSNGRHNYSVIETGGLCLFCVIATFIMLRISKGLKLFSFDLKFLTKKNIQIICLGSVSVIAVLIIQMILVNQKLIVNQEADPLLSQFMANVPSVVMIFFTFIFSTIVEEIVFRGGIIGLLFKNQMQLGVVVAALIYCLAAQPDGIFEWLICIGTNIILGVSYMKTKRLEVPIIIKMIASLFGMFLP